MERPIRWYDYITVNIYWLAITSLSQTMTPLVVPLLVQQFVGEELKGTYYGNLRLWTLMAAVLIQALMGMLSDRSTLPLGRRRPFIIFGTLGLVAQLILVGFSANLEGMNGYWVLFGLVMVQMFFANTAHGALQGLIPDLIPEEKRGRFSGVKAVLEVPLPVVIVSYTIARLVADGNLWAGLFVLIGILVVSMLITLFVPEKRQSNRSPLDWNTLSRLLMMTAVFTVVILSMRWLVGSLDPLTAGMASVPLVVTMTLAGLAGMAISVLLGVWASLRVGLGDEIKQNRSFIWWVVNRLSFMIGAVNLASFAVYFLQGRFGYQAETAAKPAAMLTMVVGVFILISAIPSGWLSDRFGRKPLLLVSGLLAAFGTLVIILAPTLTLVYVGGVSFGMATGLFYAVNWALGTDLVPKERAGKFLGMSNVAGAGAGAIGAYIGGPIADLITRRAPEFPGMGYTILFAIYMILFLVSVITLKGIQEKHGQVSN